VNGRQLLPRSHVVFITNMLWKHLPSPISYSHSCHDTIWSLPCLPLISCPLPSSKVCDVHMPRPIMIRYTFLTDGSSDARHLHDSAPRRSCSLHLAELSVAKIKPTVSMSTI
jgi:hypothetical protein